ncbi:hypothetical protein [Streptomyces sp. NPDC047108]|uniref:hypothetical protein n=1 Tax=Streptomyces sp. NPDC047108 TaxID=3155025 RepID=UPI0033D11D30
MTKTFGTWTVAVLAAVAMGLSGCGSDSGSARTSGAKDEKAGDSSPKGKDSRGRPATGRAGTSNGVEKLPATEIAEKASEALRSADSVRLLAKGANLRMDRAGNCAGTVTFQPGSPSRLIRKGEKIWLKPEDSYWATKQGKAVRAKVPGAEGKYFAGTKSSLALGLPSLMCDANPLRQDLFSKVGKWTKDGLVTLGGRKAVVLRGTTAEGASAAFFIATEGKPLPVKVESERSSKGSPQGGQATFRLTDYDEPVTVTPPGDSIDVSKVESLFIS